MCIECIRGSYPDKSIEYTEYKGEEIHIGVFKDVKKYKQYVSDKFDGALPLTIDGRLIGTYFIN